MEGFKLANKSEKNDKQGAENSANTATKWVVPMARCYKINVDVALAAGESRWGCGTKIRDEAATFTTAMATDAGSKLVLQLEAVVVLEGLKLTVALGINHVEVETDLQLLVQYLSLSTSPISHLVSFILDI